MNRSTAIPNLDIPELRKARGAFFTPPAIADFLAWCVYLRHVEEVIAGKDKRAYAEATRLIDETMRALFAECGRTDDFDAYVDEVRTTHKAKRNLMKAMGGLATAEAAR